MSSIETTDGAAFMQGQIAALELALRAVIGQSPDVEKLRETLSTAAGRVASDLAQAMPEDFSRGWYHTLRRVNGPGPLPVVGAVR